MDDDEGGVGVGQGKLYSPGNAVVKKEEDDHHEEEEEDDQSRDSSSSNRVRWRNIGAIKDKLLEKLSAAPAVPADALDNARQFLETVVRDVRVAAHGLTVDALARIKFHLSDFLPSLSPALTNKMVEDAEEAAGKEEEGDNDHDGQKKSKGGQQQQQQQQEIRSRTDNKSAASTFLSPTSSLFASFIKPRSRL